MSRKVEPRINYNGTNITTDLKQYLTGLFYTDCASGESDAIDIKLEDRSGMWMGDWFPQKGDRISLDIVTVDWDNTGEQTLSCGSFTLDNLSYQGRPLVCNIGALSIPANAGFNITLKTKTWKNITIKQMAEEIAASAEVTCFYDAEDISIESIEQDSDDDCAFLYSVCEKYGLSMKVYSDKICIFNTGAYEEKEPTMTINETDMESWRYNTTIHGTYTGARISYTDPDKEEDYIVEIGDNTRLLQINEKADNLADAERKAVSMVNQENRKAEMLNLVLPGKTSLSSSMVVNITGLKKLDGKYFVDKVKHSIGGGYRITVELHKIQEKIAAKVVEEQQSESLQYTIVKGDNLWNLAKKYLGSGTKHTVLYELNKDVIEAEAKRRGKANSNNGHWIWPGTVITIPIGGV